MRFVSRGTGKNSTRTPERPPGVRHFGSRAGCLRRCTWTGSDPAGSGLEWPHPHRLPALRMKARASPPLSRWTNSNEKSCFFSALSRRKTSESLSSITRIRAATNNRCVFQAHSPAASPSRHSLSFHNQWMPPFAMTPVLPSRSTAWAPVPTK